MKNYSCFVLFTALAVSLVAQQPAKAKKVWTNDDFSTAQAASKPAPAQPAAPAVSNHAPQTLEETEAYLELRQKRAVELRKALSNTHEEVLHATNQDQRRAVLAKISVIERDIEETGTEIHDLQEKLTSMKAKSGI
jgi:hypothetical protein